MAGKNLTVDTTADSDEYRSSLASANAQNSPESSDIRKSPSSPARAEIMAESRKKARRATLVRNYNERWAKIQEENDVEVQNIKQRLLELESERKGPKQEERKIDKYHEYFGFDPRKARYGYKKYETQVSMVAENLRLDNDIRELKQACIELDNTTETKRTKCRPAFGDTMARMKNPWVEQEKEDIWKATRLGLVDVVRKFLERGKSPNARSVDGETPLHILSCIGDTEEHLDILSLLLKYGANVAIQTVDGYTPIMYAAMAPAYADVILQILLDNDIDGSGLNKQNKYGMTALHLMIKSGSARRLKLMLSYKPELNHQDKDGNTALMFATKIGFVDAVHMLMDAGADPLITNMYKEHAYHFACNRVMENDDDILMLLSEQQGEERYALTRLGWIIPPAEWKKSDLAKDADQDPTSYVRHAGYLFTKGDRRRKAEKDVALKEQKIKEAEAERKRLQERYEDSEEHDDDHAFYS